MSAGTPGSVQNTSERRIAFLGWSLKLIYVLVFPKRLRHSLACLPIAGNGRAGRPKWVLTRTTS